MANFLEQLVCEWHEFRGYFVRRNVRVGRRAKGGWDGELDIVAFHPARNHLVHVEPSSDSHRWDIREKRFAKKFDAGRKYIPKLFEGFAPLPEIEQIALLVLGSKKDHPTVGGGRVMMIGELMSDIRQELSQRSFLRSAVSEQYQLLRTLQFAAEFWR